jgi:hypothetical protein
MISASAWLAALASLLLWVHIGRADTPLGIPTPAAHLDVRATPECTSQKDIASRVLARAPRIRLAEDPPQRLAPLSGERAEPTAFAVRAEFTVLRSGEVVGELVMAGPMAKPSFRRVVARSCDEAADAIALIIAVTLDPTSAGAAGAATGRGEASASTGAPAAGASATAGAPPPAVVKPAPSSAEPPAAAIPAAVGRVERSSSALPAARGRIGIDLAAQSFFGPAPDFMPGVALYAVGALDRDALFSPAMVLGATHAWRTGLAEPGGTASFTLDATTLDLCAVRLRSAAIEARACGSALLGLLSSSGADTRAPASRSRPFVVAGAAAILTADLGSVFALSGRLTAGATLVRDSFEFGPAIFYRAAPICVSGSVGVGVRLP